ncbi:MAG: hypothetical protein ACI8UO_003761 [Verrucomicrobiales bacterium]|jgi:hypothetical protein
MKFALSVLLLTLTLSVAKSGFAESPGYNRDVRPILGDKCFRCHGPDAATRKADFRLDDRDAALEKISSGSVLARITSSDPDEEMPPPDSGFELSEAEIETLKIWMESGADYEPHWAFVRPARSKSLNSIDEFVRAKSRLEPSPRASEAALFRRVSLDLTGLPPTLEQLDSGKSYADHVQQLLDSPRFGEHLALYWLDAARFADTHGYFGDRERSMWPWRDWVIEAFNDNMPFDQFTIEQIAGDLLPEPSQSQKIATGFNRNHCINNETGIIEEEFRIEYVADRVKTTSTVWLGLTLECARCHDHKFDPISQRDYYRFFAFFNNVPERGLDGSRGNAAPSLTLPKPGREALKAELAAAERAFKPVEAELAEAQAVWGKSLVAKPAEGLEETGKPVAGAKLVPSLFGQAAKVGDGGHVEISDTEFGSAFSFGAWVKGTNGCVISKMNDANEMRGVDLTLRKNKAIVNLVHRWNSDSIRVATKNAVTTGEWRHFFVTWDGAEVKIYVNGEPQETVVLNDGLIGSFTNDEPVRIGRRQASASFSGMIDEVRIFDRVLDESAIFELAVGGFTQIPALLRAHFLKHHADERLQNADAEIRELRKRVAAFQSGLPKTMVMEEMAEPRQTHVLGRGEYDKPGDPVSPGVPEVLPGEATNRLEFARWLVSAENPLTARVIVNRVWQQFFGVGLVATSDDFGVQGEWPSNQQLLDWLAVEFIESGWDLKHIYKLIAMSETYQQSSDASPEAWTRDPRNRLLTRGPRFRLHAEQIRDQALAVSGLLVEKIGGPSVKPYQPPGLWLAVTYDGDLAYVPDTGPDRHRRSLYSYWKRQAPPPNLLAFDAPTRETCVVQRSRTNTPLQALVLMNDPVFIEAARALVERGGSVRKMFRLATAREPDEEELAALRELEKSDGLLAVANVILSLDETITKR